MSAQVDTLRQEMAEGIGRLHDFERYFLALSLIWPLAIGGISEIKHLYGEAIAFDKQLGRQPTSKEREEFIKKDSRRAAAAPILEGVFNLAPEVRGHFYGALEFVAKNPSGLQYLRNSQALVSLVDITESLLLAFVRGVFRQNPSLLKSSQITVAAPSGKSRPAQHLEHRIDKETRKFSHQPLKEILKLLSREWHLKLNKRDVEEIEEIIQRRHLIVHQRGRITEDYFARTPKRLWPTGLKSGSLIPLEDDYLANAFGKVGQVGVFILAAWTQQMVLAQHAQAQEPLRQLSQRAGV